MAIVCKSQSEIDKMRRSGHIVRQILDELKNLVAPGVTTMDLEKVAERKIRESGAKPAFKGYYDYPCVLCTSVNEEIVHGIPSAKRALKAGDCVALRGALAELTARTIDVDPAELVNVNVPADLAALARQD